MVSRTLICIFLFVVSPMLLFAQTEKGQLEIGAGFLPYAPIKDGFAFAFRANAGYFVKKDWSVGLMPFVSGSRCKLFSSSNTDFYEDARIGGIGVYSRYYFGKDRWRFFGEGAIGAGAWTSNYATNANKNKLSDILMLGVGVSYQLKKNLSIELNVPYLSYNALKNTPGVFKTQTIAPTFGIKLSF